MPWSEKTARERINKLMAEVPTFEVQRFEDYWPIYEGRKIALASQQKPSSPPLFNLARGKAVVVDTVQIYIGVTNYDDYRLEDKRETEASHDRAMRLLHLYYSAADRVFETSAAQRVDFHGGRVHAVVLERGSGGVSQETVAQAFAFIEDFQRVADAANRELANNEFAARFRFGVDVGTCVAINNGTGLEQEPMFLGGAANHAAKLADGAEPGIYVSDRVRHLLGLPELGDLGGMFGLQETQLSMNAARRELEGELVFGVQDRQAFIDEVVGGWRDEIRRGEFPDFTTPVFKFFYQQPPLSEIDYADLKPSRSIRMPVVSLFADLSGYTDYIDSAVQNGGIRDAVRALYVIRQEFQNVVEQDFGGRKVRFIGDCIQGVIAEGTKTETDSRASVSLGTQCAGGLHSSFGLCKTLLGNLDDLGLAIGLELGFTPISRIGIRGERSVRVASSVATTVSERMQRECNNDEGLKLGPDALKVAPTALFDLMDENGYARELDYGEIAVCLSVVPATVASPTYARAHVAEPQAAPRAHFKSE